MIFYQYILFVIIKQELKRNKKFILRIALYAILFYYIDKVFLEVRMDLKNLKEEEIVELVREGKLMVQI